MRNGHFLLATALVLFSANALSRTTPAKDERYQAGGQYTATLDQSRNQWRLLPLNGQDLIIDTGHCATGAMASPGLWLLVRDARGQMALLAPSTTALPAGRSDHVALRSCDQARDRDIAVPQALLDLLIATTGAVYVQG